MSLRWRIGLVAIIAAAVVGGFLPHGALSSADTTATQVARMAESPLSAPVSCLDASCGKGSPAPAAPSPGVALVAVVTGMVAAAAAAACIRRRRGRMPPSPRGRLTPCSTRLSSPSSTRARGAPDRVPSLEWAREAARAAVPGGRASASTSSFRACAPCRPSAQSKENSMSKSPSGPTRRPRPTATSQKTTTGAPTERHDHQAVHQVATPGRPLPHAPSRADRVGPGRAGDRRHRHHGGDQGGRDGNPIGGGFLAPRGRSGSSATADPGTTALSTQVVAALAVPATTLDAVGSPASVALPTRVAKAPSSRAPTACR